MRPFTPWALVLTLGMLTASPIFAQGDHTEHQPPTAGQPPSPTATAPSGGPMTPEMRAQMMAGMQEMMVMMQNTAVWTPQGLVVLQGNRLLHYSPDLRLQHTVVLPLPPVPTPPPAAAPGAGGMPGMMPALRSIIPAKVIPAENGLIVVRGQQVIRLDRNFQIVGQAQLPDLPPLAPAETAALCPMCQHMMMMGMMPMGGMGMSGMPGTASTPPPTCQMP